MVRTKIAADWRIDSAKLCVDSWTWNRFQFGLIYLPAYFRFLAILVTQCISLCARYLSFNQERTFPGRGRRLSVINSISRSVPTFLAWLRETCYHHAHQKHLCLDMMCLPGHSYLLVVGHCPRRIGIPDFGSFLGLLASELDNFWLL